jgi:GAF domain-containing protein
VQDEPTSIAGDFAFPMFARDRLLGFIVCSGKQDGAAAYAPDEIDAIAAVATATGLALDLSRIEALEREIATLRGRQELRVPDAFAPDLL